MKRRDFLRLSALTSLVGVLPLVEVPSEAQAEAPMDIQPIGEQILPPKPIGYASESARMMTGISFVKSSSWIEFPVAFLEAPAIFVVSVDKTPIYSAWVSCSGFKVDVVNGGNAYVQWMARGI